MKYQNGTVILEYYCHIGFNKELNMMIYLEGIRHSFVVLHSVEKHILFVFSFRSANAHTESLGDVDVISDAEV
jgi:hypothetical protein